jgi:hypothetical protein
LVFDRRCALASGDRLVITAAQGTPEEAQGESEVLVLSSETSESALAKGITIDGCDHVTFTFHSGEAQGNAEDENNSSNIWGWSCTVRASGGVYEFAAAVCSVPDTDLPALGAATETSQSPQESSRSAAISTLAHARQPGESSRACLERLLTLMRAVPGAEPGAGEAQSTTADAISELVCADGSVLSEDSIGTPYAHAVRFTVEHVVEGQEKSPVHGRRLVAMECCPVFSARDGASERSGKQHRSFICIHKNRSYFCVFCASSYFSWPSFQVVPIERDGAWLIHRVRRGPGALQGVGSEGRGIRRPYRHRDGTGGGRSTGCWGRLNHPGSW